jgi:gamma-glutamyltranspeptidase/glutathione hydrolase
LRLIAEQGPAAFYRGAIAEKLLATSRRLGGTMAIDDLQSYTPEWVDPISTTYRGWLVSEMPPNGQGIGALTMLNLMERFDLPRWDPLGADAMHVKVEAQKLAYADLRAYVADPRRARVPTGGLLDKSYAAERAGMIDLAKANCELRVGRPPEKSGNTIYLAVVDREGNIASWIQSISDLWGSGVVVDDYGFHLHDRGGSFTLDARHPNALEPGKRPFHTIIPGFMSKGDEHIGFGIMRGGNQPLAHAQFVSYVADHSMNVQAALEAPRFTKRTRDGCDIQIENRVPEAARSELNRRGHVLDVRGAYSGLMGGGQAVLFNRRTGMKFGASSPRKDGAAIPEPLR